MTTKQESLNKIINEIFLRENSVIKRERSDQIRNFIDSAINGDMPISHLTIDANIAKGKPGTIIYILTNIRLIKIEIDAQEIKSSSFLLDKIIGVERRLIDEDRAEVLVNFQAGSFGLSYPATNKAISDFFQKVEQSRIKES